MMTTTMMMMMQSLERGYIKCDVCVLVLVVV